LRYTPYPYTHTHDEDAQRRWRGCIPFGQICAAPPKTTFSANWEAEKTEHLSVSVSRCLSASVSQYLGIALAVVFFSCFFFSSLKMGCRNGGDGGILKQSCLVESDVASAADD